VGVGYSLFSDLRAAELLAILDSLGQNPLYSEKLEREIQLLKKEREDMILSEESETMGTLVDFFTMTRGDDDV
jgi:alpha-D-ribose 1-methylphosphonate 5-triphosphate synthase subunit PhnG